MLQNFYMWHDILEVNSSLPTSLKKYLLSYEILYCASQETFHKRKVW